MTDKLKHQDPSSIVEPSHFLDETQVTISYHFWPSNASHIIEKKKERLKLCT